MELPEGWKLNEEVYSFDQAGHAEMHACGLQAVNNDKAIFGSAGGESKEAAKRYAYFELLERIAIIEEKPFVDQTEGYRKSASNGVAAYSNKEQAQAAAMLEAVERDLVLKSWYGLLCPEKTEIQPDDFIEAHKERYFFESFNIKYSVESDFIASVLVGWPNQKDRPLVYGLGCARNEAQAQQKALKEMKQRYLFLKDEPIPKEEPAFEPTPFYHQDYFLVPHNHQKLKRWLIGERFQPQTQTSEAVCSTDFTFKTIKQDPNFIVVRAISEKVWPLYFGKYEYLPKQNNKDIEIHPIA